jgi:hypothetical protein
MGQRIFKITALALAICLLSLCSFAQAPSSYPYVKAVPNDTVTGTTQFLLAKINASGNAIVMATTDVNGYSGVCISNCGIGGTALLVVAGLVPVTMDNTATIGDYVTISSTTGGRAHDVGASTYPKTGAVIGRVQVGASSGAQAMIDLFDAEIVAQSGVNDITPNLYAAGGGTAQAQTVTLVPAATALVNGLYFCWKPTAANTAAAPTLAVNGLTAKPITKLGTAALLANDLTTAAIACVLYDGTEFQLQNPQTIPSGAASIGFGTDATNTNAYVITFSPALSLTAGSFGIMSVTNANNGAVTLNANGLGVKNVTRKSLTSTTALTTGDIKANFPYLIEYDGTQWNLLNASPNVITDDGATPPTVHFPNSTILRIDGTGGNASIDNHCSGCQFSIAINGTGSGVFGDGATSNEMFVPGSVVGGQQPYGQKMTATASLTAGQVVKLDTANANAVVVATTTDTAAGIPIGIVANSPGAAANAYVVVKGMIITPLLGTGTCSIGNFVIVDTTTNGRVKCTGTYTAGTIIGYATAAQSTVGSAVKVLVDLK